MVYESHALDTPSPDEPLTPFLNRNVDDDSPADGSCEEVLPDECIEAI